MKPNMSKTAALRAAQEACGRITRRSSTDYVCYVPYYDDKLDGPSTELQASTYPQLVAHRARKVARIAAGLMGLVPDSDKEAWIDLECAFEDAERCGTKPAKELLEAGIKAMRARK